jgi:hypothetical protein
MMSVSDDLTRIFCSIYALQIRAFARAHIKPNGVDGLKQRGQMLEYLTLFTHNKLVWGISEGKKKL